MSAEAPRFDQAELSASSSGSPPTRVRIGVAAVLTLMACLLYLDRFAVGIASEYIREDLRMTQTQMSWFLSAFFWSYALSQVPAGWLSDRFGPRLMLTIYILAWSAFTGLLGMAASVWLVLHLRLYMGAAQAGAFPVCGGLIRAWFPISQRGTASSIIALGGRAGGVLAPILTAWLVVMLAPRTSVRDFIEAYRLPVPVGLWNEQIVGEELADNDELYRALEAAKSKTSADGNLSRRIIENVVHPEIDFLRSASRASNSIRSSRMSPPTSPWFDWRDWMPYQMWWQSAGAATTKVLDPNVRVLNGDPNFSLNKCLNDRDFVRATEIVGLKIPGPARRILHRRDQGEAVSTEEIRLLNRLTLEAAFPKVFRKFYGPGWRPTLIAYGIVGLVVALAFAWVGRNSPKQHPGCNEAERRLIDDEATLAAKAAEPRDAPFPWKAVLTSLSLWGNSLMQVFTNIGWLFVVTWLPRYLDKVHGVPLAEQALMTAVPTAAGIVGMFFGGRWTDLAVRKAGLKWGRRLPIISTRLLAAFGYGICLVLGMTCTPDPTTRWLPWAIVMGLSVMVMGVDLGVPAVWAYAQDVGGKYTASILGWANMWGNFGAAVAPLIYNAVLGETPSVAQWNVMFAVCGVAFILSGLCGLVLDATKPITFEGMDASKASDKK